MNLAVVGGGNTQHPPTIITQPKLPETWGQPPKDSGTGLAMGLPFPSNTHPELGQSPQQVPGCCVLHSTGGQTQQSDSSNSRQTAESVEHPMGSD